MSLAVLFIKTCDHCDASEERIFTDSWTGTDLCLSCLDVVARYVTNSPCSEGDNLQDELKARVS